ncbi:hypothetical protein UlMin_034661 [Ulmus minor]
MLGNSLASPLLSYSCPPLVPFSKTNVVTASPNIRWLNANSLSPNATKVAWKWVLRSTAQIESGTLTEEDNKNWEACREAVTTFSFSVEEADKILGKAFGQVHSPYWGEERKKTIPKFEMLKEILDYLRSLSLSDGDISKVLKKFPEVLGCNLELELKTNTQILEKEWDIKGKTLRSLLLRNPRVLGYNVDCKGDCMAQCTRCWVRF